MPVTTGAVGVTVWGTRGSSMKKTILSATAVLALLAGSAIAQQRLQIGAAVSGELRRGDAQLSSGEYVDSFEFQGRAGEQVSLRLAASAFDAYLMVSGPGDFSAENDDGQDGDTGARLDLRLPASGTYRVLATSYQPGEGGRYTLDMSGGGVQPVVTDRPVRNNLIEPGATVRDTLQQGDAIANQLKSP